MFSFPTFSELEARRDKVNADFQRNTKPVLAERLQQFGFHLIDPDYTGIMKLTEGATGNHYLLSFHPYSIIVMFQHIKTDKQVKICEISNFALSAHTIMEIIITSIDCWLQYGVVYDYVKAQEMEHVKEEK
ncbi:MAG: addiction module toxin RelE [Selenomonadaceae bacterium]|nr:addiction module toxin RelE [Selenomonadaceae bacterium]